MGNLRKDLVQYLQYVQNTDGNATVAAFDEDWGPIGPQLRAELMPKYVFERPDGKLALTEAGQAELHGEVAAWEVPDDQMFGGKAGARH